MRYAVCALLLMLAGILASCASNDSDSSVTFEHGPDAEEGVGAGDGTGFADRTEADAALDTARTVAADSALAYADATALPLERAWPEPDSLNYRTYRNAEYGFRFEYPDNLLQWGDAIGEDRGQSFETADGSATLLVYAFEAEGEDVIRQLYEQELEREDQRVTYHVLRPDWFVVSGYDGPHIFYQRTFRSGGGLRTFRLRHLAQDKDYFGPITERLSHSFSG